MVFRCGLIVLPGCRRVWEALAGTVGMTALIRNLARMTRVGAIAPFSATAKRVAGRLSDTDALNRAQSLRLRPAAPSRCPARCLSIESTTARRESRP
jgi:hypothetical protein